MTTPAESLFDERKRPLAGWWYGRYFVTVVVFGYGVCVGPNRTRGRAYAWQRDWTPIEFFRNCAYRRPFA